MTPNTIKAAAVGVGVALGVTVGVTVGVAVPVPTLGGSRRLLYVMNASMSPRVTVTVAGPWIVIPLIGSGETAMGSTIVAVRTTPGVGTGVGVAVGVGVGVGVGVAAGVAVGDGVAVTVGVGVALGAGVPDTEVTKPR